MPILIHGKKYVMVNERVGMAHDANKHLDITTELISTQDYIIVKATAKTEKGTFTGYAEEKRGSDGIAGQSPLEVAETSAVGRALGFAGYGAIDSIASAEEVVAKIGGEIQLKDAGTSLAERAKEVFGQPENAFPIDHERCSKCGCLIMGHGTHTSRQIASFSRKKYGKPLCMECQNGQK